MDQAKDYDEPEKKRILEYEDEVHGAEIKYYPITIKPENLDLFEGEFAITEGICAKLFFLSKV